MSLNHAVTNFTMIKTHDIQKFLKEEQNALLATNNEANLERQLFEEEGGGYLRFLLTMSLKILYRLCLSHS